LDERRAKRAVRATRNRAKHYAHQINTAPDPMRGLAGAFDYLRAVADPLPDTEKRRLIRELVRLADERNKP
jgi:hypothetical protein